MNTEALSFRCALAEDRDALSALWQEAFSDGEQFFSLFFENGFLPENSLVACIDGKIAAALYWFDFFCAERKLAYIYGVATFKEYRGLGIGKSLMKSAHKILESRRYDGAILVPAGSHLFSFYDKLGYKIATKVCKFEEKPSETPAEFSVISPERYAERRKEYTPADSVNMGERGVLFFGAQYLLIEGEDFLLSGYKTDDKLIAAEFLGNRAKAPDILRSLGCNLGKFRTLGENEAFSMYYPFFDFSPPSYLGIAFD